MAYNNRYMTEQVRMTKIDLNSGIGIGRRVEVYLSGSLIDGFGIRIQVSDLSREIDPILSSFENIFKFTLMMMNFPLVFQLVGCVSPLYPIICQSFHF